jgi:hypothetical protein
MWEVLGGILLFGLLAVFLVCAFIVGGHVAMVLGEMVSEWLEEQVYEFGERRRNRR